MGGRSRAVTAAQEVLSSPVGILEEMGADELGHLENVIARGRQTFVEVGEALLAIRERRGYRAAGFATFEEYLRERWGWSRQRGYQLIQAAHVVADIQSDQSST